MKALGPHPSPRDLAILTRVAQGWRMSEIEAELGLSPRAATKQLQRLTERLCLGSVRQVLIAAGARGWVTVDGAGTERTER